jgi:similar to stage IV sporulation protein
MKDIKHNVLVSVSVKNKNKLLLKIYENGIGIYKIKYYKNKIEFETSLEDYLKLKKYIVSYKFKIKKNVGVFEILSKMKNNKVFLINLILSLILIYIFSNTIVSVRVIHSKKYIRDIVSNSLEEYGVTRLSWKKSYKELNTIKEKILEKYPKNLEWLEIEKVGMNYIVRVEERIITEIEEEKTSCNVIATNDGIITKISSNKGQNLKQVGDYVTKGDIIISGEIKFNEETKNIVCASGEVLGEAWYTTEIKLPFDYSIETYTGKKRYNFAINNTKIFRSRLKNYKTKKKKLFSIFGNDFYLLTEKEVKYENKKYSEDEALKKALELSNEKINLKLSEKEHIISQKVLKNSVNDSTMYVEVFTSVEEIISEQVEFIKEEKEVE